MLNFKSSLEEFFDKFGGSFDSRDLISALVVYANQYINYRSTCGEHEVATEMTEKIIGYNLQFIADYKDVVVNESCNEVCWEDWTDFFTVLDWIKKNWDWSDGDNYFERFEKLSENEPTMIHEFGFEEHARGLAEDCFLSGEGNPLFNHINWNSWANEVKYDYTGVTNPLNPERTIYYRSY